MPTSICPFPTHVLGVVPRAGGAGDVAAALRHDVDGAEALGLDHLLCRCIDY